MTRKNTQILVVLCVIAAFATLSTQSRGQGEPPASTPAAASPSCCVAIVDFVRVFNECTQIKDLNDVLRKQEVDVQTEAKQRQKVIEDKQIELSAFQPGTPDYQQRRKDLIRLGTEANIWLKVCEQDLEAQKFDWTKVVYQDATKVVGELATERGYQVVLQYKPFSPDDTDQTLAAVRRMIQERAVVHADPSIDITNEVINRLNKAYLAKGGKKQLMPATDPAAKP
ncbi:MAG: OmpH family outer membrane protein [Planctomycetes bacterium]|nr:OmpH family outer membrane protein [Planctomycetota bacterium]